MSTTNSWNNQIAAANSAITLNSGTNTVSISTDASATTVNVATGGAVKTSTFGSTNSTSATTVQSGSGALNVTSTNGALTVNSGTGALGISTDASATTVSLATGGAVKTVTLGSTNSTSATTVQSGSGALNVTSTNGAMTINSGTGALSVSNDASATTVNLATGAAVKTVTLGSTNTTSSTAIKSGSGNVAINSGLTIDSTGRNYNTAQPAFLASQTGNQSNVTGDGTTYTVTFTNVISNQGSSFDGTSTFTAPLTGLYYFSVQQYFQDISAAMTNNLFELVSSNATYRLLQENMFSVTIGGLWIWSASCMIDMDASDTVTFTVRFIGGAKVVDVIGSTSAGFRTPVFAGYLIC